MKPIRVLALTPVPEQGAGCRFRISQYVPLLATRGFDFTICPFYSPDFFALVYQPGRYLQKAAWFLRQSLTRARSTLEAHRFDLVFLYREAFPIGPPLIELALKSFFKRPLVYDFDDAIFLSNTSDANSMVSVLKYPSKVGSIIARSDAVIAGNSYLAEYAGRYNRSVDVIPTCVDTSEFVPSAARAERPCPVVGWIGTPTTAPYLANLGPVLDRVTARAPFVLRVAGAGREMRLPGVNVSSLPWSLEKEVELFNTCDIGVYPLTDDAWGRGKCGFKAIQFMACGVPVVASPVGVNREIVQDGVNGFLASNETEWTDKLTRLICDPRLRRQLGDAGRRTIEERYSLRVNAPKMERVLRNVLDRSARN